MDELEERIFGALIVTLPHIAYTSESVVLISQTLIWKAISLSLRSKICLQLLIRFKFASSTPETNRASLRGVIAILPIATYRINLCALLHHIMVLFDSSKSLSMIPMPKASCVTSETI